MSDRINFRSQNAQIGDLTNTIEKMYDWAAYDKDSNEIQTLVKSGNESFYEVGTGILHDVFNSLPESQYITIGYFGDNQPNRARVYTSQAIKEYVEQYENSIPDFSYSEMHYNSVKHMLELYHFAINNNVDIWIH